MENVTDTDSDKNSTKKKVYITVSDDYNVKKFKFRSFDNLEKYNTLEKLQVLIDEAKNHLAYNLLKSELDKAEQIIRPSFSVLNILTSSKNKVEHDIFFGILVEFDIKIPSLI